MLHIYAILRNPTRNFHLIKKKHKFKFEQQTLMKRKKNEIPFYEHNRIRN